MSTQKNKSKVKPASQHAPAMSQHERFVVAVESVAKHYGVKVAAIPPVEKNPYEMSPEQSAKIAVEAGIITPNGRLTRRFR
jgi:hypothetical protein